MLRLALSQGRALLTSDTGSTELLSWLKGHQVRRDRGHLRTVISAGGHSLYTVTLTAEETRRASRALQGLRRIAWAELAWITARLLACRLSSHRGPRFPKPAPVGQQLELLRRQAALDFLGGRPLESPNVETLIAQLLEERSHAQIVGHVGPEKAKAFTGYLKLLLMDIERAKKLQARVAETDVHP